MTECRGLAKRIAAQEWYVFLSCCTNRMVLNALYNIGIYVGMTGQSRGDSPIYI